MVQATVLRCGECGEEYREFEKLETLYRAIAHALAREPRRLSHQEQRWLRKYLGFSGKDWADYLGVRRETVSQWENNHGEMPLASERLLRRLVLDGESFHDYEPVELSKPSKRDRLRMSRNSVGDWVRA